MSRFLAQRRSAIARTGRTMTLRRLLSKTTHTDVSVKGFLSLFKAEQVGTGNIIQGDGNVAILNDEIDAASWPGPPRERDQMIIDGKEWTVEGSTPVYDGSLLIGHSIFVRGG